MKILETFRRKIGTLRLFELPTIVGIVTLVSAVRAGEAPSLPKAFIDGTGPGWVTLTEEDFANVNCDPETWTWKDGVIYCTGKPTGVIRTQKRYTNFELVCQWRHRKEAGNSGIFVWATDDSIERLAAAGKPGLPHGIELQVLELGYAEAYTKRHKKPADWFTSHGDVFPVGRARMTPFPPVAPNGKRSFPSKNLSRGVDEWNHYYARCINGEVRLWVNGEEVSGGTGCEPKTGYICLESEGAPVEFKDLRIRELP
jgi:hypothetical protein